MVYRVAMGTTISLGGGCVRNTTWTGLNGHPRTRCQAEKQHVIDAERASPWRLCAGLPMATWRHGAMLCVCVCGPPPQHDRHSVPSKVLRRLACSRKLCPSFGPAAKEVRQARDPRE